MRWLSAGVVLVLAVLSAAAARAEPTAVDSGDSSKASPRPLELKAGGHFLFAFGDVCRRELDTVGCTRPAFTGAEIAPAWRLSGRWSLGAMAAFDWSGANDGATHSLWQAFAQGRWRPWGEGRVEPWAGVFSGVTAATDTLDTAPVTGDRSVTQYAPAVGLSLGTDFELGRILMLGVETRGLFTAFGEAPPLGNGNARSYGDNVWLWLGVGLTFRPDMTGPEFSAARADPRRFQVE